MMRKNFIPVFLLTLLCALTCSFESFAQKAIRLSHYNREIILGVDQRIKFKLTVGSVDDVEVPDFEVSGFVGGKYHKTSASH